MPRPFSQDVPSRLPMTQRGQVRYRRADNSADGGMACYAVATGSGLAFGVANRPVTLGETVTIVRHESFGMWRIV